MEKSFATLDKEANNSIRNQLNSTALPDEECNLAPKTPQRDDIKISPILHDDEPRNAFQRKMAMFRRQGDSPLARPIVVKSSSLTEISSCTESGYSSTTYDQKNETTCDSSKENMHLKTPGRSLKRVVLRNPFETRHVLDHLHTSTLSPNLMEILPSPKEKTWPIEHRSILCPANITEEEIRMSRSVTDPDFEERVHQQLEIYWESGVGYVPSPDGPRPIIVESPMTNSKYSPAETSVKRIISPAARPPEARRRCITMRNTPSQTEMTIPPSFDFDFVKILGGNFVYNDENVLESPEDDFDVSLNTSLPRRLFSESCAEDEMETEKADFNIIREDLDGSPSKSDSRGNFDLVLDLSPIRGE